MTTATEPSAPAVDDEAELVIAARGGDTSSFETLMRRYERRIYRLATTIARNESDAEDVAQEAFLKAFEHLESFKGDSRFYTWLVRITVNEALMKIRRRRPGQVSLDELIDRVDGFVPREIGDRAPTPEEEYSQVELAGILSKTISELPSRLRVVFQLRDVEGLSTDETANVLDLSISAVKSRLLHARLALRDKLDRFTRKGTRRAMALPYVFFAARDAQQVTPLRISVQ
jgi:RNA polymerase sigma-70 factor (ECF subfamily)